MDSRFYMHRDQESQLLAQPDQLALQPWQLVFPLQQAMHTRRWFSTQEHMALYRLELRLEQRAGTPWMAELRSGPASSPAGESLPIGSDRQWARHWGGGTWLGQTHSASATEHRWTLAAPGPGEQRVAVMDQAGKFEQVRFRVLAP